MTRSVFSYYVCCPHSATARRPGSNQYLLLAGPTAANWTMLKQRDGQTPDLCIDPAPHAMKKVKGSPYSITERRVPEQIPVLGSQPAGDVSHKPGGRLPLLSARPAVTPATLNRTATNFAAW